jgi:hypothetical protein
VHRIHEAEAVLDAGAADEIFYLIGDVEVVSKVR